MQINHFLAVCPKLNVVVVFSFFVSFSSSYDPPCRCSVEPFPPCLLLYGLTFSRGFVNFLSCGSRDPANIVGFRGRSGYVPFFRFGRLGALFPVLKRPMCIGIMRSRATVQIFPFGYLRIGLRPSVPVFPSFSLTFWLAVLPY